MVGVLVYQKRSQNGLFGINESRGSGGGDRGSVRGMPLRGKRQKLYHEAWISDLSEDSPDQAAKRRLRDTRERRYISPSTCSMYSMLSLARRSGPGS